MERLDFRYGPCPRFTGEFDIGRLIGNATIVSETQDEPTERPLDGDHPLLPIVRVFRATMDRAIKNGRFPNTMVGYVADIRVKVERHDSALATSGVSSIEHEATVVQLRRGDEDHWILHIPVLIDAEAEAAKRRYTADSLSALKRHIAEEGLETNNPAHAPRLHAIIEQAATEMDAHREAMPDGVAYRLITASTAPSKLITVLTVARLGLGG